MEFTIKTLGKLLGLFLVVFVVIFITNIKINSISYNSSISQIIDNKKSYVNSKNVDKTLECLAMNIYKEAGNEIFEGKVAVAQVTLNRVEHPSFPKDVCSVVHQKNVIMEKVICQFSWYCDTIQKSRPVDKQKYEESYAVAKKVLLEGFRLDSLNEAIYYHADYVNPRWQYKPISKVGTHIFYKDRT